MPELTIDEIKGALETFKADVSKAIDEKTKLQSDTASKEIAELKTKLETADKAINELKEQAKKSFGLPGAEEERKNWRWAKYFGGLYRDYLVTKGTIPHESAQKYWDTIASLEKRICMDYTQKGYDASSGAAGGFLIPPQIYQGDVIDTVYANTAIMKLPIMKLTGLKGDLPIPVKKGNLTAYSVTENEAPSLTSSTFGLEWLRPKAIAIASAISNRLLDETSNAIETIVRSDMAMDGAVELSRCLTNGKGAEKEGKGILQYYPQMTGTKNLSTNGKRFSITDLASMKRALAVANELKDQNTYGALMRPEVLWDMLTETVEMYSGQTNGKGALKVQNTLITDKSIIEKAVKAVIEDTTQIPIGTVGTSTTSSKVIYGDWSKFIVGTFRDPIFRVSDQASYGTTSAFFTDQIYLMMKFEYDCVCVRPTAFCGRDGAETTES